MHLRLVKQQGKLEALLDGESEWVIWFDSLLPIEGKVLLTSWKCCLSVFLRQVVATENQVCRQEKMWMSWQQTLGLSYVPSLPYKGWYFWFCCFSSFPMASISSAVSVFLVPSHMVIYIVLPLLMKSDKIFKPLITVPLKGKTIKEQKSSKYFNLFSVQKRQGVYQ